MEEIERSLLSLNKSFSRRIPESVTIYIEEMFVAREWGVGFEELCNQLYETDVLLTDQEYAEIESLGRQLKLDSNSWHFLEELKKGSA